MDFIVEDWPTLEETKNNSAKTTKVQRLNLTEMDRNSLNLIRQVYDDSIRKEQKNQIIDRDELRLKKGKINRAVEGQGKNGANSNRGKAMINRTLSRQEKLASWDEVQCKKLQAEEIKRILFGECSAENQRLKTKDRDKTMGQETVDQVETKADNRSDPATQKAHSAFGSCLEDYCAQSWSDPEGRWVWVKKGLGLVAAELGLGFPARKEEIERFGHLAKRIIRARSSRRDCRSFAEAAISKMNRRDAPSGGAYRGDPRRRQEDDRSGDFHSRGGGFMQNVRGNQGYTYESDNQYGRRFENRGTEGSRRYEPGYGGGKRTPNDRDMSNTEADLRNKLLKNKEGHSGRFTGPDYYQGETNRDYDNVVVCYNCNEEGHHQGVCRNPPFCFNCKSSGHKAMACPLKKDLVMYGFGFPDAVFHSIHYADEEQVQEEKIMGLLTILDGVSSESEVKKELIYLLGDHKDWRVKDVGGEEYLVTFPDQSSLAQITKFKSFSFQYSQVSAKVQKTDLLDDGQETLISVWVRIYNFPRAAKQDRIVRSIACMAGEPEEVDKKSLDKFEKGPIRVKVAVKNPTLIKGETGIYFNKILRRLRWEVEDIKENNPIKAQNKFDRNKGSKEDDYDDEEDDMNTDDHDSGYGMKMQIDSMSKITKEAGSYKGGYGKQQMSGKNEEANKLKGEQDEQERGAVSSQGKKTSKAKPSSWENLPCEEDCNKKDPVPAEFKQEDFRKQSGGMEELEKNTEKTPSIEENQTLEEASQMTQESKLEKEKAEMSEIEEKFEARTAKLAEMIDLSEMMEGKGLNEEEEDQDMSSQIINEADNTESRATKPFMLATKRSSRVREDGRTIQAKAEKLKEARNSTGTCPLWCQWRGLPGPPCRGHLQHSPMMMRSWLRWLSSLRCQKNTLGEILSHATRLTSAIELQQTGSLIRTTSLNV